VGDPWLTLHRVAGKQALGITGAWQLAQQNLALDLQIELVASELLLQSAGIAYKELRGKERREIKFS